MKLLKIVSLGILLFILSAAKAQSSNNLSGTAPMWGPAGYSEVRYYYLPGIEAYYDIQSSMFIYVAGGTWVRRKDMPTPYPNYDLYAGYKVVMVSYTGNTPYTYFKDHKRQYPKNYQGQPQKTIGNKP